MPTPSPTLTTLVTFNGVDGQDPEGTLLADAAGNLYGTTSNGGTDTDNGGFPGAAAGTVFEIVKSTNSLITLATFNGTDGALPYGSLIADAAGNLYGTTSSGGANGDGSVFEIAKGTDALTTLVSFDGTNGAHPGAGLVADAAGNLYGTTAGNGQIPEELLATGGSRINLPDITAAVGNGTVFEISGAGFVASVAPPVVAVTSPAVVTAAAVQTISGTVTDSNAVGSVSIYDNGSTTALATATVGAGGAWSTVATLPTQGSNSLVAEDTDLAGNTGSSTAVVDTLYTAPPTLAAAESISGLTKLSWDLISGTVSDPAGVSTVLIKDGTTVLGNATITGTNWSYTASSLADGSHSFTAVATDDAVKVRLTHFKQCDAEIGQHGGGCFKQRSGMAIIHALAFLVRNSRPVGAHRINDGLYRLSVLTAAIVHWNTVYLGPARLGAHRAHRRLCLDQR